MIVLGEMVMANGLERNRMHSRELWSAAQVVLPWLLDASAPFVKALLSACRYPSVAVQRLESQHESRLHCPHQRLGHQGSSHRGLPGR